MIDIPVFFTGIFTPTDLENFQRDANVFFTEKIDEVDKLLQSQSVQIILTAEALIKIVNKGYNVIVEIVTGERKVKIENPTPEQLMGKVIESAVIKIKK